MAAATYTPTTMATFDEIWRKIQADVHQGFNFESEEWSWMDDLDNFKVAWSQREILVPMELNEGYGAGSLPDGGYEAMPSSPEVDEISLSWLHFNKRFTITKQAKWVQMKSPNAMIEKQMKFQAGKSVETLARYFSDSYYGVSAGYRAMLSTDPGAAATSHTLVMDNAFGYANIDGAAYIANLFKVGDRVALIRAGALVDNAIGTITAVDATVPDIDVSWIGSANPAENDYVVLANSQENATVAGTDYDKGLVGLIDGLTSDTVHGLSATTATNWSAVTADSTGGRLTGTRIHKAGHEIRNKGGGKMDQMWLDQGVERDMIALQQAAVRHSSSFGMEMDGSIKSKGLTIKTSRRVPAGFAIMGVKKSLKRMTLLPKPGKDIPWEDGYKIPDKSAYVFGIDWPCAMVWLNRGNFKLHYGLTEQ